MIATVVFVGAYAAIAAGRVPFLRLDRTGAAVVGAVLMVATGAIGFDAAVRAVDARTIVLLFSMMVIVAHLRLSGGVSLLAREVSARVTNPRLLVAALVFSSGLLSALFVNDTICLLFTPIVIDVATTRRLPPLPLLIALATGANIGSVATLVGNPQNMLIGALSGISFTRFAQALIPIALAGLAIDIVLLLLFFRRELSAAEALPASIRRIRIHRALLFKTMVVTTGVFAAFVAGVEPAVAAAAGAAALLVTRRVHPRKVFEAVDWDLLLLFIGLFVIVGGGEAVGLDRRLFEMLRPLGVSTITGLTATSALLSNAVSNVPAVMLFAPLVPQLPDVEGSWLALAMSSTLAGNLTILGSIANLIVVEGARRRGIAVTFAQYAMLGIPLSFLTLALGVWWLA